MTLRMDYDLTTVHGSVTFALEEHFDLDVGGDPHSYHVLRVFARVAARGGTVTQQIAAILHDAVEDTPYTPEDLSAMGATDEVLRLVAALTKDRHDSDEDYYNALVRVSDAILIKDADVDDNIHPDRIAHLPEPRRSRSLARKQWAKDFLAEYLDS